MNIEENIVGRERNLTAAQGIVECIRRENIKKVFCVPGESFLPVLDALYDEDDIDVISARHEGGASFMAEGYAKASLKPGVVLATRAVGGSNLAIGVHTAFQDSTPMVVLLGQVSQEFRGREGFQEADLDRYFQHIAKWTVEIRDSKRIPEIVGRAFRVARTGRPGPVVISLPEDILADEAEMQFGPPIIIPRPSPSQFEVKNVEANLSHAKKPLIIAGGGVKSAQAEDRLVTFAEKFQLPVIAAFRRHDVFPNDHPLYVGHLGLGTEKEVLQTVKESDLILALGTRLSEVTTQDYSIITPDKRLIHIDIDFDTIGKVFAPHVGIVADVKEALALLNSMTVDVDWHTWRAERRKRYEKVASLSISENDSINKQIIAILERELPSDAILTNDAGNFAGWLHAFYPFREKHTYIGPTSGAMGYGMPAALGAKLAYPERHVVSLSGDGGFMMTAQEIETAVRYNIPIISIVFNNNMYGTIRMHQEMHYPEKVIATELGQVSYKNLALGMGAVAYQVDSAELFENVFDEALKKNKVTVIEVITGKEQISVSSTITSIREKHSK
ncbi:thiamine pyrophosphate-dependent enzyme [Oceanobacillus bengalensis]|uniref:Acetolactate synthase n=1 Tax=Oceanobacillus bengalensis TaxID=1435466 RepID=A0A494YWU5_9BACI|nr:thiamine pyrophosphate-dependent enzyme [Oceanobacillus bengalensis]RKQ14622.1 acetolactate synthase [Oceanobacillus bengalensis]